MSSYFIQTFFTYKSCIQSSSNRSMRRGFQTPHSDIVSHNRLRAFQPPFLRAHVAQRLATLGAPLRAMGYVL